MEAWCFLRGRAKVLRSREAGARLRNAAAKPTFGKQLLAEHVAYYKKVPLARREHGPLKTIEQFRIVQDQRDRKREWREYQGRLRQDMASVE